MNHTIYFRKDNWDRFSEEENKSDLINTLLTKHYGNGPKKFPQVQVKIEEPFTEEITKKQPLQKLCPHFQEKGKCMHKDAKKLGCNK